ncbi:MAG: FN3 associated domain-containing protein, partial [Chitinophagaceae bacterium]
MRFQRFIVGSLFPLSALLIFLFLFENRIVLPPWLQVTGRMHPLLLHFPVVLMLLYSFWILVIPKKEIDPIAAKSIGDWLLLLTAFTSIITALMGLFLSKEPGYDPESLSWHKWGGIIVALLAAIWFAFRRHIEKRSFATTSFAILTVIGILFTGHQGAGITHGQNFLFAPLLPEKQEQKIAIEDAMVYTHMIQPILKVKCMSCHNSKKAKGELVMETKELLLKGGKNGVLWDSTEADYGLLMKRVHLPLEQKKHMPPQGKSQLTDEELQVLNFWIKGGANFTAKVTELPVTDTLRLLAEKIFTRKEIEEYDFESADEKIIKQLNNSNRLVFQQAQESPALVVNFYNKEFFNSEELKALLKIKEQVVSLDCSNMPLKDDDLKTIAELKNLRSLNLNFTSITGKTINELQKLSFLRILSIAGTAVHKEQLAALKSFPQLQKVAIWNTSLSIPELESFKQQKGKIRYEIGKRTDTMVLKLSMPIFQNEEKVITGPLALKLKHYINGVAIRYTTDGSEPDSIQSKLYDNKVEINRGTLVKAKAFKSGWISSDVSQQYFFKSGFLPDSVQLLTAADPKYSKGGGKILFDLDKGDLNTTTGKWLGFKDNKMEAIFFYKKPIMASTVTVSMMKFLSPYIFPPSLIEVWGGNDAAHLKLLGRLKPDQPLKDEAGEVVAYEVPFAEQSLRCIKVIAVPVGKLPAWHPGKGSKGWVFVDELLV